MNEAKMTIAIALLSAACTAANAAVCPVKVGEATHYVEPKRVYDELKALNLRKSEYETAKEFEARVKEAMSQEAVTASYLLRGSYFPEDLTYVAEREEFIIKEGAWGGPFPWGNVFGGWGIYDGERLLKNPWRIKELDNLDPVQGVWLVDVERLIGTTAGVAKIERHAYAVFDEEIPLVPGSFMEPSRESWKCELKSGELDRCSVRLSAEREKARSLKENLSVGIVAKPKPPLAATGTKRWKPTAGDPRDITVHYRVIVADILCAVLSGQDGKIVKTVEATP